MTSEQHLGAIFEDRASAEAAVADLRELGLADDYLGACILEPDSYVFEESPNAQMRKGLGKGIAVGAPVGAVAGMSILAVGVPGLGTLGVAGVLAGAATGTLAGTWLGAFFGLSAGEKVMEEEADWERVPLEPGQLLIVVAGHSRPEEVVDTLHRHGGRLVPKPEHQA